MQLSASSMTVPRVALNLRVRWTAGRLTRDLAGGTDPGACPELTLRAAKLTRYDERYAIARGLENVLSEAEDPPNPLSARARFDRASVRESRADLRALAQALRDTEAPRAQGVARAELLLTSYDSPLYVPYGIGTIAQEARAALAALR